MKVNFELVENYAISYEGRLIDLHNNFIFSGYQYLTESRKLILSWKKGTGEWIAETELETLSLTHSNISYLDIAWDQNDMPIVENAETCLYEISFFPSSDRMTSSELTTRVLPDNDDDIIYMLESGYFFRIKCEDIFLSLEV